MVDLGCNISLRTPETHTAGKTLTLDKYSANLAYCCITVDGNLFSL